MTESHDEKPDENSASRAILDDDHDCLWGFVSSSAGVRDGGDNQDDETSLVMVSRASSPRPVEFRSIRTPSPPSLKVNWPLTLPWLQFQVLYLKKAVPRPSRQNLGLDGLGMLQRSLRSQDRVIEENDESEDDDGPGLSMTSLVTAMGSRAVVNMISDTASLDRAVAEIAKSVPETYKGEHAAALQAMLDGDTEEANLSAFKMLVYQVSNNLIDYDDDDDSDNKYERIVALFRQIGLPRSTWEEHFAKKQDRSSRAFAEKLFEAAVNAEDLEVMEVLLKSGIDPNQPISSLMNCFFERPIQIAADNRVRNVEMARLLIKAGADVDGTTADNPQPAIHNAAKRGTSEMVQLLVESGAEIYRAGAGDGHIWDTTRTPLSCAADTWLYDYERSSRSASGTASPETEREDAKILRYLASLYQRGTRPVHDKQILQDALLTATSNLDPYLVHILHQAGGDVAKANSQNITPLMVAASHWDGDTGVVSYLLEHGAPIDEPPQRPSALHIAAARGNTKIVILLIKNGADINLQAQIDKRLRRALLGKDFNPPDRRTGVSYSPLQLALHRTKDAQTSFAQSTKTDETAVALLEAGADLVGGELVQAVRFLSRRLVGALLERGADPNEKDSSGRSALQVSLKTYQLRVGEGESVSDILVDAGAAVGRGDLYAAFAAGDVKLARVLADNEAFFNDTGPYGESLLEAALCSKSQPMIDMALASDKAPYSSGTLCAAAASLDLTDADAPVIDHLLEKRKSAARREPLLEATAISMAAFYLAGKRSRTLGRLLNLGFQGNTCLLPYEAEYHNYIAIIQSYRFFESLRDNEYKRPGWWRKPDLIRCSPLAPVLSVQHRGRLPIVRALLKAGYRPDPLSLLVAIWKCTVAEVETLIRHGANVNRPARHDLDTPLQLAIRRGNTDMVRLLLRHRADVNALPAVLVPMFTFGGEPNDFGPRSALQMAVEKGHLELIDMLLAAGADVNGPTSLDGGASALQCAASKGYLGIARTLIDAGAEVNAPRAERYGRTALEAAAEWGRLDMVQFLLENGAEVDGKQGLWQYLRAIGFARRNGHVTVAGLLEEWRELRPWERRFRKYWGLLDECFVVPCDADLDEFYGGYDSYDTDDDDGVCDEGWESGSSESASDEEDDSFGRVLGETAGRSDGSASPA